MTMRLTRPFVLTALIASAAVFGPLAARAENATPPPEQLAPQQQTFNEDQLKAYAVAALQVSAIQRDYANKIVAAQQSQPEKIEALNSEAQGKMADAVRQRGLSVETYNNITRAARAQPEVRQHIMQLIREAPTNPQ